MPAFLLARAAKCRKSLALRRTQIRSGTGEERDTSSNARLLRESRKSGEQSSRSCPAVNENSEGATKLIVLTDESKSDDEVRKFAGRATGNSCKAQFPSEWRLRPASSFAVVPTSSWHGDFSAVFGASHTCAVQNTPQTGVASKSKESAPIKAPFARETMLAESSINPRLRQGSKGVNALQTVLRPNMYMSAGFCGVMVGTAGVQFEYRISKSRRAMRLPATHYANV
jgi:hypothetical protein